MQFSFGILAFNHEKLILETLESIKYQISTYGNEIDVFLYISDDASKDHTIAIIEKWLAINQGLFKEAVLLKSDENRGTTYSYERLLRSIKTEFFKIIAGDDVFAMDDVFEMLKSDRRGEAIAYIPLILKGNELSIPENLLFGNLRYQNEKRSNCQDLCNFRYGGYFNTPSFFLSRKLINDECIRFMRQFVLYEDDPTWYKVLCTNKELSICFETKIKVLYRIHENTVSNSGRISENWYKDSVKLFTQYLSEQKSFIFQIYVRAYLRSMERLYRTGKERKIECYRLLERIRQDRIKRLGRKYLTESMRNKLNRCLENNKEYYTKISSKSKELYEQFSRDEDE